MLIKIITLSILFLTLVGCGLKTAPQSQELDYRPAIPFKTTEERSKK